MWLLPGTSSPSAPVSEGSSSESAAPSPAWEPEGGWWVVLSGTPTQRPASWRGWKKRPWILRLSGLETSPTWTPGLLPGTSISSALGSLASLGAGRARSSGLQTSATSGESLLGSCAKWDPATSSWRMSQNSLPGMALEGYSESFPSSGSMRNGACFPRAPLERPTAEGGSGFLPTPAAADGSRASLRYKRGNPTLLGAMLPTPTARDGTKIQDQRRQGGPSLGHMARAGMLPTPTAQDARKSGAAARDNRGPWSRGHGSDLGAALHGQRRGAGIRLRPLFVAWMMGLPQRFASPTVCAALATPLSQTKPQPPSHS